jgi:hypothetical protein
MSLFIESQQALDHGLRTLDSVTYEAPDERLGSPNSLREIYDKCVQDDLAGSYNRSLIQQLMDYTPPHDNDELENKGQSDRFNITTGEGPAIKNEAVSAYMDIYTTPRVLAEIPLLPEIDPEQAATWSQVLAEEYTFMDRSMDSSLPNHLLLADTYVTHGVAIPFFDDKQTLKYTVAGLERFKFPRKTGIVSSDVEFCCALGYMPVTELYRKRGNEGWDDRMIEKAIVQVASSSNQKDWNNWETIQRSIKSNDIHVSSICDPIEVIFGWVKEFDGKISFYIAARKPLTGKSGKEEFLFKSRGFYDCVDEAFQIFAFSVGNGGLLYTVRGLGYLVYQICNAMDIMHNKLLDNARIGSSLIFQPASIEDLQDMQLIDFGGGVAIPPTTKIVERPMAQNLNNSLIPAIEASRGILNRATGGLASSDLVQNPSGDRRTELEVSSQLDNLNKSNSFAITLFYGPYDKITREKVKRAFTIRQTDVVSAKAVKEMKQRCIDRGVPEEVFKKIDFKRVKASRIIGTGSRASRIMLMQQLQQMYSTWDDIGRNNFDYDMVVELAGAEKADRYAGKPEEKRQPIDASIATLENFQLAEGDYMDPLDGQMHLVHIPIHLQELEVGLQGIEQGQIDLGEWTMQHSQLYKHLVATLEMATAHQSMQPLLNSYRQRAQQIGEIVDNGMKHLNKLAKDQQEAEAAPQEGQEGQEGQPGQTEDPKAREHSQKLQQNDAAFRQKMQMEVATSSARLALLKKFGEQKMVLASQEAMSKIASRDADARTKRR